MFYRANDLEELLLRADEGDMSVEELHALQKRLSDTETQLSRILKTMKTLDAKQTAVKNKIEENESENEDENDKNCASKVTLNKSSNKKRDESDEVELKEEPKDESTEKVRRRKGKNKKKSETISTEE